MEVRKSRSRQITQNAAIEELGYVCRISSFAAKLTQFENAKLLYNINPFIFCVCILSLTLYREVCVSVVPGLLSSSGITRLLWTPVTSRAAVLCVSALRLGPSRDV